MSSLLTLKMGMGMVVVVVVVEQGVGTMKVKGKAFFIFNFIFKTGLMPRILVNKLSLGTILLNGKATRYC